MSNGIKVTPIDIQQKRFHVGFRGYDQTEVEMFLDLVRDEMETLAGHGTAGVHQTYDERAGTYREEETVKNTLLMTQKLMEDQKDNAQGGSDHQGRGHPQSADPR
jgi:DivIVA domain-containing protein